MCGGVGDARGGGDGWCDMGVGNTPSNTPSCGLFNATAVQSTHIRFNPFPSLMPPPSVRRRP